MGHSRWTYIDIDRDMLVLDHPFPLLHKYMVRLRQHARCTRFFLSDSPYRFEIRGRTALHNDLHGVEAVQNVLSSPRLISVTLVFGDERDLFSDEQVALEKVSVRFIEDTGHGMGIVFGIFGGQLDREIHKVRRGYNEGQPPTIFVTQWSEMLAAGLGGM